MNNKLIDEIETVLENSYDKPEANKILTNYIKLLNFINNKYKYKIYLQQSTLPIKIILSRKDYKRRIELKYIDDQLFIDNCAAKLSDINDII